MLDRIDPIPLRHVEAQPVSPGGGREPDRQPPSSRRRAFDRDDEAPAAAAPIDDTMARLAPVMADIERVTRGADWHLFEAPEAEGAAMLAALIVRNGAIALAAQAGLGPAGVRLVLDACDDVSPGHA